MFHYCNLVSQICLIFLGSKLYLFTYRVHYSLSLELIRQDENEARESKSSMSSNYSPYNRHFTDSNNGYSDYLLYLQATIGNRAMQSLVRSKSNESTARGSEYPKINIHQPKLKISQPGDSYEQEADKVADQAIRMRDPLDSLLP